MKKAFGIIVAILTLNVAIIIHEFGHFLAFQEAHIPVETFAVGIPVPYLTLKWHFAAYPETTFECSPLFVGGYNQLSRSATKLVYALPLEQQVHISARGIEFGLFLGIGLLWVVCILMWNVPRRRLRNGMAAVLTAVCLGTVLFPFVTEAVIFPLIGLAQMSYTISKLGTDLDSPIGFVRQISQSVSTGITDFLRALVSLTIGYSIFNMIPLAPLDGGEIIIAAIARYSQRAGFLYDRGSKLFLVAAVGVCILVPLIRRLNQLNAEYRALTRSSTK